LISAIKETSEYDALPNETASQLCQESDKIILRLLKNKADPNFQNMDGETALMFASTYGRASAMELLLEYGADPNIQGGVSGNTALMSTITFCRLNDMKLLIAYGADPNIPDKDGYTALSKAQRLGCANIVAYLKYIGEKYPSSKNIFEAAKFGDLSKVQQFIREGADVNSIDKDGVPVLNWALESNQIDVIEELLKAGSNVNTSDDVGITPLILAVTIGDTDLVKLLIKYGADVDAYGGAAASYAKKIGAIEVLEVLRKAGAKIK
jgi:ankyrin repeat protein